MPTNDGHQGWLRSCQGKRSRQANHAQLHTSVACAAGMGRYGTTLFRYCQHHFVHSVPRHLIGTSEGSGKWQRVSRTQAKHRVYGEPGNRGLRPQGCCDELQAQAYRACTCSCRGSMRQPSLLELPAKEAAEIPVGCCSAL